MAPPSARPPSIAAIALAGSLAAGGCTLPDTLPEQAASDIAGVSAGGIAGGLTGNPVVGVVVGLAARSAAGEGVDYVKRVRQDRIQQAIATVAGDLEPGVTADWSVEQDLPGGDQRGRVEVVRRFGGEIRCRELVFSVRDGSDERFFVGTICQGGTEWRWAVAEPSTRRWRGLQ